jgi:uncharacterized protein YvpB
MPGTTAPPRPRRRLRGAAVVVGSAALLLGLTPPSGAAAASLPSVRHIPVPVYRQQLADDCEATALRMVLAYRGHRRSDRQLLGSIGVDLTHPQFGHSGSRSGDPFRAFVGNPDGNESRGTGYGVYYPRIAAAARAAGGTVLVAQEGYAPSRLYAQLAAGHPAVVWIDYLYRTRPISWYRAYDGRWIPYAGTAEHAIALVGVTPNGVYVNDPARGYYWISKARFQAGYASYLDMAVVLA